jgi:osmotically-inducible protein OsmY
VAQHYSDQGETFGRPYQQFANQSQTPQYAGQIAGPSGQYSVQTGGQYLGQYGESGGHQGYSAGYRPTQFHPYSNEPYFGAESQMGQGRRSYQSTPSTMGDQYGADGFEGGYQGEPGYGESIEPEETIDDARQGGRRDYSDESSEEFGDQSTGFFSEYGGHPTHRSYRGENGPHRGKGPRNYRRGDERITEDINESLTQDGRIDAEDIEVSVSNGEVTLSGTAQDRREKRWAEDLAEQVSGVSDVSNQIRIKRAQQQSSISESRTTKPGASARQ